MRHIVILKKIYYDMIMDGSKTIESRWAMSKFPPYNKVSVGDTLYFKVTGCDVTATATVSDVKFYELTPELVEEIRIKYGKFIGTDKFKDWKSTLNKKYCSLVWIKDVKEIEPMKVKRSNGAGWIIMND